MSRNVQEPLVNLQKVKFKGYLEATVVNSVFRNLYVWSVLFLVLRALQLLYKNSCITVEGIGLP